MTQKRNSGDTVNNSLKMLAQYSTAVTKTIRKCGTIRKRKGRKLHKVTE